MGRSQLGNYTYLMRYRDITIYIFLCKLTAVRHQTRKKRKKLVQPPRPDTNQYKKWPVRITNMSARYANNVQNMNNAIIEPRGRKHAQVRRMFFPEQRAFRVLYHHLDSGIPEQKVGSSDSPHKVLIGRRVGFVQSICEVGHHVAALVADALRSIG